MINRLIALFFLTFLMVGGVAASIASSSLPVSIGASDSGAFQTISASSVFKVDSNGGIRIDGVFSGLVSNGDGTALDVTIAEIVNGGSQLVTLFSGQYGSSPFTDTDAGYMTGKSYLVSATGITGLSGGSFSLTVSAVPLPAAAWLFGSALLGFVAYSRRNKV